MEKIYITNGIREIEVTPKVFEVVFKSQGYKPGRLPKTFQNELDLGEVVEEKPKKRAPRKKKVETKEEGE